MTTEHKLVTRLKLSHPPNSNIDVLVVLTRYEYDEDDEGVISNNTQHVLTTEGWKSFEPYALMDLSIMPTVREVIDYR